MPLSCAAICAAGACLPLAKMVVHIAKSRTQLFLRTQLLGEKSQETAKFMHTLRLAQEAAETTGQETAQKFVMSCANKAPQLLGKVIDLVGEDIKSMIATLTDLYSKVTARDAFKSALDEGILDGSLGASMCNDESVQKIYRFLHFGMDSFTGLKQVMIGISGAGTLLGSGSFDMSGFEVTTATAKAVIQTIQEFSGSHESGAGEEAASEPHSAMYRDFEWQGQGRQVGPHAYGGMRFASYGMLVCYVNIGTVCRRFRSR